MDYFVHIFAAFTEINMSKLLYDRQKQESNLDILDFNCIITALQRNITEKNIYRSVVTFILTKITLYKELFFTSHGRRYNLAFFSYYLMK